MKFECPHCEKLGEPTDFRVVEGAAHWTCPHCGKAVILDSAPGPNFPPESSSQSVSAGAAATTKTETKTTATTPATIPATTPSDADADADAAADADADAAADADADADTDADAAGATATANETNETKEVKGAKEGEETKETKEAGPRCPKCGAPRGTRPECARCGLVYARWDPQKRAVPADPILDPLWQEVLADYDNPKRHDAFFAALRQRQRMDLGAARYGERLRRDPTDEAAQKRLQAISIAVQAEVLKRNSQQGDAEPRGGVGRSGRSGRSSRLGRSGRSRWMMWVLLLVLLGALLYLIFWGPPQSGPKPPAATNRNQRGPGGSSFNLKNKR